MENQQAQATLYAMMKTIMQTHKVPEKTGEFTDEARELFPGEENKFLRLMYIRFKQFEKDYIFFRKQSDSYEKLVKEWIELMEEMQLAITSR